MKQKLINHFTWLVNNIARVNECNSLSDKFKVEELEISFKTFYQSLRDNNLIDFENLTAEEATELRFEKWNDESKLWLIPLYIKPLLPKGLKVTAIDGKVLEVGKDYLVNDVRGRTLPYGVVIK